MLFLDCNLRDSYPNILRNQIPVLIIACVEKTLKSSYKREPKNVTHSYHDKEITYMSRH